jgi:hypothetical protein
MLPKSPVSANGRCSLSHQLHNGVRMRNHGAVWLVWDRKIR